MARILIVEDDAIAAELSALRLRGAAHHVDIVVAIPKGTGMGTNKRGVATSNNPSNAMIRGRRL